MENIYNPSKLTKELIEAGLPVAGVSSDGRIDYARKLTKAETQTSQAVVDAHDTCPPDVEVERLVIAGAGVSQEDILMALWTQAVRGDSSAVDALVEKIDKALSGL